MSFADTLSDGQRKNYRRVAVISAICGGFSTQIIENNAPVVLYLAMLGANDSLSMFSTSLTGLATLFLLIPGASFCAWLGLRKTYTLSSALGFLAFMLITFAPFFGNFARQAVIFGGFLYGISQTIYQSTWYPLLDNILKSDERSKFFTTMRFIYMIFMALVLYGLGEFLRSSPELWLLQTVFVVAGLTLWGRKYCMDKLPIDPAMQHESPDLRKSLSICLHNQSLTGYSVYLCFFYIAYASAIPLALVYMKTSLNMAAGTIMILTSINMAGKITGFFLLGKFGKYFSTGKQTVINHLLALIAILLLLSAVPSAKGLPIIFGIAFFLLGIVYALVNCIAAVEMLSLARPGNKIMAIAFCMTCIAIGTAAGTLLSTALIGCGALAEHWQFMGIAMTKFQLLFGICALLMTFIIILFPLVPAVIGRRDDYYQP